MLSLKIRSSGLVWLWVVLVVLVIDRWTKLQALSHLNLGEPNAIIPCLNFTLAYNTGAAFSFLDSASGWQTWFFGIISVVVSTGLLIWLTRINQTQRLLAIAVCLIIGGALGNLTDRFSYGHVIDFIDVYVAQWHWPVFNIADSAVCCGALLLFFATSQQE